MEGLRCSSGLWCCRWSAMLRKHRVRSHDGGARRRHDLRRQPPAVGRTHPGDGPPASEQPRRRRPAPAASHRWRWWRPRNELDLQGLLLGTEADDVVVALYRDGATAHSFDDVVDATGSPPAQTHRRVRLGAEPVTAGTYRVLLRVGGQQARRAPRWCSRDHRGHGHLLTGVDAGRRACASLVAPGHGPPASRGALDVASARAGLPGPPRWPPRRVGFDRRGTRPGSLHGAEAPVLRARRDRSLSHHADHGARAGCPSRRHADRSRGWTASSDWSRRSAFCSLWRS